MYILRFGANTKVYDRSLRTGESFGPESSVVWLLSIARPSHDGRVYRPRCKRRESNREVRVGRCADADHGTGDGQAPGGRDGDLLLEDGPAKTSGPDQRALRDTDLVEHARDDRGLGLAAVPVISHECRHGRPEAHSTVASRIGHSCLRHV